MRAMILAAGFGTRLGALGLDLPKPLFPVCNAPLIRWAVALLAAHGIREIVVNLHHQGEQIRQTLGDGRALGVDIAYSVEEGQILGTGGGIKKALPLLGDETFVVMNGKIVIDLDLHAVLATHRRLGALASMVLKPDPEARSWGAIGVDPAGRIRRFLGQDPRDAAPAGDGEKGVGQTGAAPPGQDPWRTARPGEEQGGVGQSETAAPLQPGPGERAGDVGQTRAGSIARPDTGLDDRRAARDSARRVVPPEIQEHMFTGVHVFEPAFFEIVPDGECCVVRSGYRPWFEHGAVLGGHVHPGYFWDHSTPARFLQGNLNLVGNRGRVSHPPGPITGVHGSAEVHPTAQLADSVLVGEGAVVEREAVLGPEVVVGPGARVEAGVCLCRTVVMANARLSRTAVMANARISRTAVEAGGSGAALVDSAVVNVAGEVVPVALDDPGPRTGPAPGPKASFGR